MTSRYVPIEYAIATITSPNDREVAIIPPGVEHPITDATPHAKNVRANVPTNSDIYFFIIPPLLDYMTNNKKKQVNTCFYNLKSL